MGYPIIVENQCARNAIKDAIRNPIKTAQGGKPKCAVVEKRLDKRGVWGPAHTPRSFAFRCFAMAFWV